MTVIDQKSRPSVNFLQVVVHGSESVGDGRGGVDKIVAIHLWVLTIVYVFPNAQVQGRT